MFSSCNKAFATSLFCFASFAVLAAMATPVPQASQTESAPDPTMLQMAKDIRKAIITLPEYGVFDWIHFAIKGKTVILEGYASRPTLKSAAEKVVKNVKGVQSVQNDIEVLPNSPNDDRIRAAVYRRIYSQPSLQKYTSNRGPRFLSLTRRTMGITYDPPVGYNAIHIIVKNGNVTLLGAVDNSSDAAIASIQANSTPGVFSVDNDLVVTSKEEK